MVRTHYDYSPAAQRRLDRAQRKMTKVLGNRWREPIENKDQLAQIMTTGFGPNGEALKPRGRGHPRYVNFAARALVAVVALAVMAKPDPLCARCGHKKSLHGNPKAHLEAERVCHSLRDDGCGCPAFKRKKRKARKARR